MVPPSHPPFYTFPPDDLIPKLVDLYFSHVNIYEPLLHRPTFERAIAAKQHMTDEAFGANLLLVCAIGARWSHDPRVFLHDVDSEHSCGWRWFSQVPLVRKSLLQVPSLADLQFYCVSFTHFCSHASTDVASHSARHDLFADYFGATYMLDFGRYRRANCTRRWCAPQEVPKRAIHGGRGVVEACMVGARVP